MTKETTKLTKPGYSFWIGVKKTIKNGLITLGPSVLLALASWQDWIPVGEKYVIPVGTVIGVLAYLLKNYIENK